MILQDILDDKEFRRVRNYDNLTDFIRELKERIIEGVLNRVRTRAYIADIAAVTNKGEYITSSEVKQRAGEMACHIMHKNV